MALAENEVPAVAYPHISTTGGVVRVQGSRVTVVHLVRDYQDGVLTPEQIQQRYPHLSLAEIHAALTYYYDHREELDGDIERRKVYAEEMRAAAAGQFTRAELEERLRREQAAQPE